MVMYALQRSVDLLLPLRQVAPPSVSRLLLSALLVVPISGCDLFGGDGGNDDATPVTPAPPIEPPRPPPIVEQVIYEPPVVDAPMGNPTSVASYRVDRIGLVEPGDQSVHDINEAGHVVGTGWSESNGHYSWLYSGGVTRSIGWSSQMAPSNAVYEDENLELNEEGQVIGSSYIGSHSTRVAWLHSAGANIRLGLTGSDFPDTENYSQPEDLNDRGQVAGSTWMGKRTLSWLYSEGDYRIINLTDQEHTSEDGTQISSADQINDSGAVVGGSTRYIGSVPSGTSCWLYRDGTTYQIGLLDQEHTHCSTRGLNESGQAIGKSDRYHGNYGGYSAWLYSDGQAKNIGLTDTYHTYHARDRLFGLPAAINEVGQVLGLSASYYSPSSSYADSGRSVWLYENGITRDITLTGREYTRFDGRRVSSLESSTGLVTDDFLFGEDAFGVIGLAGFAASSSLLNDAGYVVGYSTRYDPASSIAEDHLGQTAWLYKNGSHTKLGITDAAHTTADGGQNSIGKFLNQAGQVAGQSYMDGAQLRPQPCAAEECRPRTAWFYDPGSDQIYRLVLSTRSDGFSLSEVLSLSEEGTVLGYYMAF